MYGSFGIIGLIVLARTAGTSARFGEKGFGNGVASECFGDFDIGLTPVGAGTGVTYLAVIFLVTGSSTPNGT
jgi:hypothetical protein